MVLVNRKGMVEHRGNSSSEDSKCQRFESCNVVLLGNAGVGKSALADRAVYNKFTDSLKKKRPTSSWARQITWKFQVAQNNVKLNIFDINCSSKICSFGLKNSPHYVNCFHQSDVFLLCYNIADPKSLFDALNFWCPEIRQISPGKPIILVGCQADSRTDRNILTSLSNEGLAPVSSDQALSLSQQNGLALYAETNAKSCQRSAISAFEAAVLVAHGRLERSKQNPVDHSKAPPVPSKPFHFSPPVPAKPKRTMSSMTINKENLYSPEPHQYPSTPRISTRNGGRMNGASSMWSLSSHQSRSKTPKLSRKQQKLQQQEEHLVPIKCQRLNIETNEYEEVEVQVPQPIYETLKLYNDKDKSAMNQETLAAQDSIVKVTDPKEKKSKFSSRIKKLFVKT